MFKLKETEVNRTFKARLFEMIFSQKKELLELYNAVNGTDEQPDVKLLKLSDAFTVAEEHPSLELEAVLLNINRGHNRQLMDSCRTLRDYTEYTARVREYAEEMKIDEAVERAIAECIREGILSEFLSKYRAEAKKVSIYEYDEEKHMRQEREENWRDGNEAGIIQGREEERKTGIKVLIETCKELGASQQKTVSKLVEKFSMSMDEAEASVAEYWEE